MVHEIHLGAAVAIVTILIPIVMIASSVDLLPLTGSSVLQDVEAARPESLSKVSENQNALETLKQLYNDQAFSEIERCLNSNNGISLMCTETMDMLIATCNDSTIERIDACDDPRLQSYRNRA